MNNEEINQNVLNTGGTNAEIERLSKLFGGAQLSWTSSQDPEIPMCLREDGYLPIDEKVLTIRCGQGLGALVAYHHGVHHLVTPNPVLRQGLRSWWESGLIFWVRVSSAVAAGKVLSPRSFELVTSGLIPVVVNLQERRNLIELAGPLIPLESLDLGASIASAASCTVAPGASTARISAPEDVQDDHPSSQKEAASLQVLERAFGTNALVGLKNDVLTRLCIMSGNIPLELSAAAEGQVLASDGLAGAVCGEGTKLLALAFAAEQTAREFLKSDPALSTTLVTRLNQVLIVWLQPSNQLPPTTRLAIAHIISHGIVPVYTGRTLEGCSIFQPGKPVQVDLGKLVFPPGLADFFEEGLRREQFGPPLVPNNAGGQSVNTAYWADLISKATKVRFSVSRGVFVQNWKNEPERVFAKSDLYSLVVAVLRQAQVSAQIPAEEFRPERIKAIIEEIRMSCVLNEPTEDEAVLQFVQTSLERRDGAALAKAEAALVCREFFKSGGFGRFAKMAENKLRHKLSRMIDNEFGIGESHDDGRVFHNLTLRSAEERPGVV